MEHTKEVLDPLVLREKIALVTGSTAGIGRAIAYGLAKAGAQVWIHGRNKEVGERIAQEVGGRFIAADLEQPTEIAMLVEQVKTLEHRLDILVNNAGIEHLMAFNQLDMLSVDRMWQVNVRAPLELTYRFLPLLQAAPSASIINVTSIHENVPYPQNSIYCMTKAALAMFTKTAAIELAPFGIRVNNLAPGAVETDINRALLDMIGRQHFQEWIPLGRVAQVDEIVGPALFLASDASSYMTGATLTIDGGYSQHVVRYRPNGRGEANP